MGLLARIGRRSTTGATPGEAPRPAPQVAGRDSGRGTLSGGVLAADRGLLMYGIGGPHTTRPYSKYPGPGDERPAARPSTITALAHPLSGGVTQGLHTDSSASPINPPYPPVIPAGEAALRGRLSGAAFASESGAVSRGPGELVNLRYVSIDPKSTDPDMFLPPVREVQGYRPGRMVISYYIDPQRRWGVSPFFNGSHQAIRATPYVSPPQGRQTAIGGPHPTVYRTPSRPWDQGVIRGTP